MSHRDSNKGPVTFQEVAGFFSDVEWKLLHEWQKELYRNVMHDIHQAFISLGPLIAASVFSLKSKEQEYLSPVGHERGQDLKCSSKFASIERESFLEMKEDSLASVLVNPGTELGESTTATDSEHMVIRSDLSVVVKEEEDTYCMDLQDSQRTGCIRDPAVTEEENTEKEKGRRQAAPQHTEQGDGSGSWEYAVRDSAVCPAKTKVCKPLPGGIKVQLLQSSENVDPLPSNLLPETNQGPGGQKTTIFEGSFNCSENLHLQSSKEESSGKYNECQSNLWNEQLLLDQPNANKKCHPYASYECEKSFITKHHLMIHQRMHNDDKQFQCNQCEKSFKQKESLIEHLRTHTGQRPYQCTECGRSFCRKRSLTVHYRIHTGDKLYHCTECEKSFRHQRTLIEHQRKHTGQRPYQCTECEKNFSRKRSLVAHWRTHSGESGRYTGVLPSV